ncbi:DUF4214 domain-containing protein [Pseudomonas sp. 21LCFQ02]|uniref:DUF4214 domain-containing protein n=1 Tax=Pseudomonas sp. 21LCFQ02 TaxID=2957505 RepID=UPI00209B9CB0|nr:DUF4214 domain-containing protein [Pseudomonas sp. 21LCFQ02]MCO8166807.1 DUF4214 domain-containing protein [Pseudomonas sp. 21LCFQ02]
MATLDNSQSITALYIAAFGRAPDKGGLAYWTAQMEAGLSFDSVISSFLNSQEAASLVGQGVSDQAFLNTLYSNVLNRAPDTGGAQYWQGRLDNLEDRAALVKEYISSISDSTGNDTKLLQNKIVIGQKFAASVSGDNTIYAKAMMTYVTSETDATVLGQSLNDIFDGQQPVQSPVVITPKYVLHEDTGVSATDGITKNGVIDVTIPTGATWEYTFDGGQIWQAGTGSSFELSENTYSAGSVNVRYTKGGATTEIGETEYTIVVDHTAPTVTNFTTGGGGFGPNGHMYFASAQFSEKIAENGAYIGVDPSFEYQSQSSPIAINFVSNTNASLEVDFPSGGQKVGSVILPVGVFIDLAGNESEAYTNNNVTLTDPF